MPRFTRPRQPLNPDQLYARALRLLSFRPRSTKELRFRLKRLGGNPADIDQVLARLGSAGLTNDREFGLWLVASRHRQKRHPLLIKRELRRFGLDPKEFME